METVPNIRLPLSIKHLGRAPHWNCATCAKPWPCRAAKGELLREFQCFPSSIILYMSTYMVSAISDLSLKPDSWERFMGWIRPRRKDKTPGARAADTEEEALLDEALLDGARPSWGPVRHLNPQTPDEEPFNPPALKPPYPPIASGGLTPPRTLSDVLSQKFGF
jgi:hypothetical protein